MLVVEIFAATSLYQIMNANYLGRLQNEGASRALDALQIAEVAKNLESFYTIVADAVINRNGAATHSAFEAFKTQSEKDMLLVRKLADTEEENAQAEVFASAYKRYLDLCIGIASGSGPGRLLKAGEHQGR